MDALGWDTCDIIIATGDAYVDHRSFGIAIIGRLLEAQGFRVGIIAQPDWRSKDAFSRLGRPNLYFGVAAGKRPAAAHWSIRNAAMKRTGTSRWSSAASKHPCVVSRTTITGRTRRGGRFCSTPAPIFSGVRQRRARDRRVVASAGARRSDLPADGRAIQFWKMASSGWVVVKDFLNSSGVW